MSFYLPLSGANSKARYVLRSGRKATWILFGGIGGNIWKANAQSLTVVVRSFASAAASFVSIVWADTAEVAEGGGSFLMVAIVWVTSVDKSDT